MKRLPAVCQAACLLVLLFLPGACSLPGKQKAVASQSYVFQSGSQTAAVPPGEVRNCLDLRIGTTFAAPGFTTARMAYTEQEDRLDYFAHHQWVDTPARMLSNLVAQGLETSGLFGAVLSGSPEIRTDLRLDMELLRLQQDFRGTVSTLEFAIRVSLVDVRNRSLMGSRLFDYSVVASQANPESGVAAANRAADSFVAELIEFLAASVAAVDCTAPG